MFIFLDAVFLFVGLIMKTFTRLLFLLSTLLMLGSVSAEQVTKEQIKGLDEQVQDIKKDVLLLSMQ